MPFAIALSAAVAPTTLAASVLLSPGNLLLDGFVHRGGGRRVPPALRVSGTVVDDLDVNVIEAPVYVHARGFRRPRDLFSHPGMTFLSDRIFINFRNIL